MRARRGRVDGGVRAGRGRGEGGMRARTMAWGGVHVLVADVSAVCSMDAKWTPEGGDRARREYNVSRTKRTASGMHRWPGGRHGIGLAREDMR